MAPDPTGNDQKAPTNQWDVAIFLVQRFPIYALLLAFLAAGYFAVDLLLRQRDQAQQELEAARTSIATEREASERRIAETLSKADERIAAAAQRERAAYEAEANAKSNALFSVQDTLLTSSERIQKLVTAQISSMEQLDELRLTTATELDKRIEELQTERETILAEVATLRKEKDLIALDVSLQNLQRVIDEGSYNYLDEIKALEVSFSADQPGALAKLEERRLGAASPALGAAIFFALYRKTGDTAHLDAMIADIGTQGRTLGDGFYRTVFGCCDDRSPELWEKSIGPLTALAGDDSTPPELFLMLVDNYFDELPSTERALLQDSKWSSPALWKVTTRLVSIIQGTGEVDPFKRGQALTSLRDMDFSAAHALAQHLQTTEQPEDINRWARDLFAAYPDIAQVQLDAELAEFWMSANLAERYGDYQSLDLSAYYPKAKPE